MQRSEAIRNAFTQPQDRMIFERQRSKYLAWLESQVAGEEDAESLANPPHYAPTLELDYPGPLYGVLRWIMGYTKEVAHKLDEEETAHYLRAKELGMNPKIELSITADLDENGLPVNQERFLELAVSCYVRAASHASQELLEAIRSIHDTPENKGEFDKEVVAVINSYFESRT